MNDINETEVRYEVWGMALDGSQARQTDPHSGGYLHRGQARGQAVQYDAEERGNAHVEQRPVRRKYVVVEAATTRKVVE